jgi:hypothetical protein
MLSTCGTNISYGSGLKLAPTNRVRKHTLIHCRSFHALADMLLAIWRLLSA